MAQNITLLGASYSDVPAVTLPKTGGGTASFTDVTDTTAAAADVASGKYFYTAAGVRTQGTSSGGSASAWTKIAETTYSVNTTSTSAATVATWETGHSEIWTSAKWVYVRIRDTAGKRGGYFYGSDNFFLNRWIISGSGNTNVDTGIRYILNYTTGGTYGGTQATGTTGYGVYADTIYSDGRIRIRQRYSSSSSLTINGTYKVEVYLLDPAGGVSIFE